MNPAGRCTGLLRNPKPQDEARVSTPIAEDFAAIRARMVAIREAERLCQQSEMLEEPAPPAAAGPADFYAWLMGGRLWSGT